MKTILIFLSALFLNFTLLSQSASKSYVIKEINTPNEYGVQVIEILGDYSADEILNALLEIIPKVQSENETSRQMANAALFLGIVGGDYSLLDDLGQTTFTDKQRMIEDGFTFLYTDAVKMLKIFYNVTIDVKDGKFRVKIYPIGFGGSASQKANFPYGNVYTKNTQKVKPIYADHRRKTLASMEDTISQIKEAVIKALEAKKEDW